MSNKIPSVYLSYTGYKTMRDCPESYYRKYVLRQAPPAEDQRNFLKGNALHHMMEAYLDKKENNPQWLRDAALTYWEREIESVKKSKSQFIEWKNKNDEQENRELFVEWANNLADIFIDKKLVPANMHSEFKADSKATAGGICFKMAGRIDILMESKSGEYVILDLKASASKTIKDLDQLVWYCYLAELHLGKPVRYAGYIMPAFKELDLREIPQVAKDSLMERVGQALQDIRDEKFDARPENTKCWFCPVKFACSAHGGAVNMKSGIVSLGDLI